MKVEYGFETSDGDRVVATMPDIAWDLYCIVDRYFHRDKYEFREKVDMTIKLIIKRLKRACINDIQKKELNNFLKYVKKAAKKVPPPHRDDVEKKILQEIAEKY